MPLVVVRDGVTYRMIGGLVIEERVNGEAATQYYPHRDYTSSVRAVTDGTGAVAASLGYDGDWGSARIAGQEHVSSDAGMEAFYRFQSQEAEIFPLSTLNITDTALEAGSTSCSSIIFRTGNIPPGSPSSCRRIRPSKASLPMRRWAPIRRMSVIRRGRYWTGLRIPRYQDFVLYLRLGRYSRACLICFSPIYTGTVGIMLHPHLIIGGGRLLGIFQPIASGRYIKIPWRQREQDSLVRGLFTPSSTPPDSKNAVYLYSTFTAEFFEALVGAGVVRVWLMQKSAPLAKPGLCMLTIGFVDLAYGHYSNRNVEQDDLVYYLVDDHAGEKSYLWAIFRRGASDALFYTAMGLAWKTAVSQASEQEAAGFMFSMVGSPTQATGSRASKLGIGSRTATRRNDLKKDLPNDRRNWSLIAVTSIIGYVKVD